MSCYGYRPSLGVTLLFSTFGFGVVIFYGVVTAVTFFLYWRTCKNISMASLYTTSSIAMLAISLSAAFGIDFFSAVGAAFMPH